ncbi:MAG: sigma-54-dependent Fis family transcriptional regulator [Calditrichaeota bacterium]|nr:sigma-54-dependent Fis family transcriptional regulator [Candidatus Cloacimonadota bacterium]MCB1045573.1 sigma-54-dependent Fis family transcriptional regulator [Calditrichota bacterium]MCB9473282.1 sigma-54-dependent Fis family transcriptional regulator [Candidatus Delongbacteria bacterium]
MTQKLRILLVDDEINMLESLGDVLRAERYQVATASSGPEAIARLEKEPSFDLMITDLKMPRMNGMELLEIVSERWPSLKTIVLTGHGSIDGAVRAMRMGAFDYILKPFQPDEALKVIQRLDEMKHSMVDGEFFMKELSSQYGFDAIIGNSEPIIDIFRKVATAAKSNASIFITGESGTGKELLAHVIHYFSNRANRPFIKTSCASFGEGVLESELFGHEKGAFTHAQAQRKGRFELANTGTLFLDEVGDIPMHTQIKLVRVLQTREFERVGGTDTIKVDVRLIAATHQNIPNLITERRFREDLYYRLNVIPIHIPPLRERREDIPLLIKYFLERFSEDMGKKIEGITKAAMNDLINYDWPGNIRELRNIIERAVVFCDGRQITVTDLSHESMRDLGQQDGHNLKLRSLSLQEAEWALITHCLNLTKWNLSQTAKMLEISRGTLYSKMVKLGLRESSEDGKGLDAEE